MRTNVESSCHSHTAPIDWRHIRFQALAAFVPGNEGEVDVRSEFLIQPLV
jgi:hypothetical protein